MSWFNREKGPESGTYRLVESSTGKPERPIAYRIEVVQWIDCSDGAFKSWMPVETLYSRDEAFDRLSKYRGLPTGSRVIG